MAQGRSSAAMATMAVLLLLQLTHPSKQAYATTYLVGGSGGWTFNLDSWPKGKTFKAGDTLCTAVFKYDPTVHNVVAVDKGGYGSCRTPAGARVYKTGKDLIQLKKGFNYFICNFPGHCESGMKIAVNAS
ncbi:unnamed protein product [Linum tenue]|uniref:Basic blue protein n=1 Tax=Linum tenue TaxID=586396 RepID=A0AAV0IE17_9ROSI|nr:unnamed protein product [Linum tenue]